MAEKRGKIRITASAELAELQRLNGAIEKMEARFLKSVSAASLLNKGWGLLLGTIKEGYAELDLYSKATVVFTGNLELMREATKGTVADLDLMQAANRMTTLGVKLTDQEMATLLGDVKKLAEAMGIDMKSALESTATALARESDKIADNIGVVMKAERAHEVYAASIGKTVSALTDAERKIGYQKFFTEQAHAKALQLAEGNVTLTESFKKLAVSIKNATMEMLNWINKLPAGTPGLKMTRHGLEMPTWSIDQEWLARQGEAPIKRLTREGLAEARASQERNLTFKEGEGIDLGSGERIPRRMPGTGKRKKAHPWWDRYLEEMAKELEEEAAYILARETRGLQRKFGEERKGREQALEAEEFEQRAGLGREFAKFGREVAGEKLRGTPAGRLFGDEALKAALQSTEAMRTYADMVRRTNEELQSLAEGGIKSAFGGLLELADAAVSGEGNIAKMALNMLKAVSMGLSQQLFAMGLAASFEASALAAGVVTAPFAAAASAKAGVFYAGAAALGALGLGFSAASAAVGGGSGAGANRGASSGANYRPSFGTKTSSKDLPPIVIRLTFDRNDPASESMARRKVKADMLAAGYEDAA